MREIKFRGQDVNGNWLVGSLVKTKEGESLIVTMEGRIIKSLDKVQMSTVGQFTGIYEAGTDGAGVEEEYLGKPIYEGDIVRAEGDFQAAPRVVVFYECMFGLATAKEYDHLKHGAHPNLNDYAHLPTLGDYPMQGPLKVLGNIHDNPELLEEGGGA